MIKIHINTLCVQELNMTKKYRKIGLRRENNLADVSNKYTALSNILNGLSAPGETFIPEDIAVINNLRNTNVTNNDFTQLKGLRLTYLDSQNTERTVTPIVTLEDRIQNYQVPVGDPPYILGGSGMTAKFIPASNIASVIDSSTTGSTIFSESPKPIQGPLLFWDNGVFEFQNLIYPDFDDPYGMIQWEGFVSPILGDQNITLNYTTTGLILIEQDPLTDGSWETVRSVYNSSRSITFTLPQALTLATTIVVGENIKYLSIGDRLTSIGSTILSNEVSIINVNLDSNSITLDSPINLSQGSNTLTFEFNIGETETTGFFRLRNTFTGDKIKIRITVWWPTPSNSSILYNLKTILFRYVSATRGQGNFQSLLSFDFLLPTFDRQYVPNPLSIEYFLKNSLSATNAITNFRTTVNSPLSTNYTVPLSPLDRIIDTLSIQTFIYSGLGKISKVNYFSNTVAGDYFIRKSNYTKTYQIKEKGNVSTVYISFDNDIIPTNNGTFDGFIIQRSGLVGVYNILNGVISALQDNDFPKAMINTDQVLLTIDNSTNQVRGFFRITSYDYDTGSVTLATVTNTGETPSNNGIAVVYRSSSLEDLSKLSFCKGVIGKEVKTIVPVGATKIYLKDTLGLAANMYVQMAGFIPNTTQINTISSDAGGSFITLKNGSVSVEIKQDITLTFSPDSINRELCVIPLNTAPPFAGTDTGLITQSGNESLTVNKITVNNLEFKNAIVNNTVSPNTVTKSMQFSANGETYRFLIK